MTLGSVNGGMLIAKRTKVRGSDRDVASSHERRVRLKVRATGSVALRRPRSHKNMSALAIARLVFAMNKDTVAFGGGEDDDWSRRHAGALDLVAVVALLVIAVPLGHSRYRRR